MDHHHQGQLLEPFRPELEQLLWCAITPTPTTLVDRESKIMKKHWNVCKFQQFALFFSTSKKSSKNEVQWCHFASQGRARGPQEAPNSSKMESQKRLMTDLGGAFSLYFTWFFEDFSIPLEELLLHCVAPFVNTYQAIILTSFAGLAKPS